jgi:galactoside O-acetyltransferase
MNSFYNKEELLSLGLKTFGDNVLISKKASIYSPEEIVVGNNVRIDDFCILSGKITLGNNIHISAYCALYGRGGISIDDYSGISARTTIYSLSDDFSGDCLIGVMVPEKFRKVIYAEVKIEKYCQVGSHSIVLPGVNLSEGCVVGAASLVNKSLEEWTIYAGVPAKRIKQRNRDAILNLIKNLK